MSRLSPGQLAVLERFNKNTRIGKEIPEYWNPKPLLNDQIDRLEARGFIEQDGPRQLGLMSHSSFYKITTKGAARIGMEVCKPCGGATHPNEAACIHCGKMKEWIEAETRAQATEAELAKLRKRLDALALNDAGYQSIKAYEDRAEAAEQRVKDAVKVLEPFAKAADIKLCGDWRDDERFAQTDVGHYLNFGHLRAARAFIKEAGE